MNIVSVQDWSFDGERLYVYYMLSRRSGNGLQALVVQIKQASGIELDSTSPLYRKAARRFSGEIASGKLRLSPNLPREI